MRSSTSCLVPLLVSANLVLCSASIVHAGPIAYSQPPVFPAPFFGWTSDRTPDNAPKGPEEYQTWDNFIVDRPTLIDGVSWQGFYWDFDDRGKNPVHPDTESWEISFWSDANAQPLASLQVQLLPVADVQSVSAGFAFFQGDTVPVFNFHVTIPPFLAQASTMYWLSILSISPTFNPIWSWMQGTGGNDSTFQVNLISGERHNGLEGDRTFSLEGQTVPEPSTLSLLLTGVGCVLGYWWLWRERFVSHR
ncbi:MAG: PEP-CTERM sorting domain-containing protein [Candidatus Binatia bacterium]